MHRSRASLAAAMTLGLLADAAHAERLPWPPLRDATLHATLVITAPDQPPRLQDETVSVQAQSGDTRLTIVDAGYVLLTQFSTGRQFVVFPDQQRATEIIPESLMDRVDVQLRTRLTTQGTKGAADIVAGTACTDWHLGDGDAVIDRCIDDNNIPLRERQTFPDGGGRDFVATSVNVAPLDAGLFRLPLSIAMNPPAQSVEAAIAAARSSPIQPRVNTP